MNYGTSTPTISGITTGGSITGYGLRDTIAKPWEENNESIVERYIDEQQQAEAIHPRH